MKTKYLATLIAIATAAALTGCADQTNVSWAHAGAGYGNASFDAVGAPCGSRWVMDYISYKGPAALADINGKCPGDSGYNRTTSISEIKTDKASKPAWFGF